VAWTVEVTDQFESWWHQLTEDERISVDGMIRVLEAQGPGMGAPYSIELAASRFPQLRQLTVPHGDHAICVLYSSDEGRETLVLLTGTTAAGEEDVCPPDQIALADAIYDAYLAARTNGH
jgi:hypothetical protein